MFNTANRPKFRPIHLFVKYILSRGILFLALFSHVGAQAQELTVEGSVDETPAPLKRLSQRAAALENRLRELEQRLAESQKKLMVTTTERTVEYRLDLATGVKSGDSGRRGIAVSHLRTSFNGRPYTYTQSAVIINADSPLPLFLGPIEEGKHLAKIQFQVAPVDSQILSPISSPWQTIEKTIPIEITADGGSKQTGVLEVVEKDNKFIIEAKTRKLTLSE